MDAQILIVEDNEDLKDSMQEFFGILGFRTFSVAQAEEALGILKANAIDVVITDIKLPGIDGLELTDQIKKEHDAAVIVMTGYSDDYSYEEAVSRGASDFILKPVRFNELLLRLKRVLNERTLTRERIQLLEELKKQAITDGLTKLYNSRHFFEQLEIEIARYNRYGHPLSLLLLDIDYFKKYNDSYGHLEGDQALVRIGQIIQDCLRKMDLAFRYGGEEFAVILPETSLQNTEVVAERLRKAVAAETFTPQDGRTVTLTISVGAAQYVRDEELTSFVKRADNALFASKESGRNQITAIAAGSPA